MESREQVRSTIIDSDQHLFEYRGLWEEHIEPARRDLGFEPKATIETGLASFVQWYKAYHGLG